MTFNMKPAYEIKLEDPRRKKTTPLVDYLKKNSQPYTQPKDVPKSKLAVYDKWFKDFS